jgi:hypothetical protein
VDYVHGGGHLVMTFKSGFTNEYNTVRWSMAPGPLRKAAGFRYQEFSNLAKPLALKGDPFKAGADNRVSEWAEMVLQQGREIHLWGKADPGETIRVTLAGKSSTASADSQGRWSLQLAPIPAGGPFTLQVAGKRTIMIRDVMIGEVWVASGQSNMAFGLSGSAGAAEELPKADYPDIRLFTVPKRVALDPQPHPRPRRPSASKFFAGGLSASSRLRPRQFGRRFQPRGRKSGGRPLCLG